MRFLILTALLLAPAMALAQDTVKPAPMPEMEVETVHSQLGDWLRAGSRPQDYTMGMAPTEGAIAADAFYIRAKPVAQSGYPAFATFMQIHPPGEWSGKRVRLSARVKTENVPCAQIWMRVDPKDRYTRVGGQTVVRPYLAFYNMDDRLIRGTTDWKLYEVVLDVSDEAARLAWGFTLIGGRGTVWADSFTLEVVDRTVPVSVWPPGTRRPDC